MVYALDRVNSHVLFVDLKAGAVTNSLYVGKDPTSFDIDESGNSLYVANKGPGTGLPGSYRITVVDLNTQTAGSNLVIPEFYVNTDLLRAVNVTAGRQGRLYYNGGFDLWNGGLARAMDADTGDDLGEIAGIKTMMVISSDKSRLYGQYVYDGNLGEMGVWNVSTDTITQTDSLRYSPYPYGWDYENYSLSANDRYLAYGQVLFNATNLLQQYGLFEELIYALNHDGSIAYGSGSIWDTTTFPIHGDATKLQDMPFPSTVMKVDEQNDVLYAFNAMDHCLYVIERATSNGIPYRWLSQNGMDTNEAVETEDVDHDGYTALEEWALDSDPTNATPSFAFVDTQDGRFTVAPASSRRWYALEGVTNLIGGAWIPLAKTNGTPGQVAFDLGAYSNLFYRISVSAY